MREKGMKNIALVFLIAIAISVLVTIGVNFEAFSFHQDLERNRKQSAVSSEAFIQIQKDDNLNFYYIPKIDSLLNSNPKQALGFIDKILENYPNEYTLNTKKGIAYYRIDSFQMAVKEFKLSMKIQGWEQPKVLAYLSWCYFQLEDYDSAITEMKKASQKSKGFEYDWELAQMYEVNGNYEKATEYSMLVLEKLKKENDPIRYWKDMEYLQNKISELKKKK